MGATSESREVMLTVATDGEGKVWAENERGEVVGLAFVPQDDSSWDAVESVVQQARMFGERAR